ncbi:hypothetical protein HG549_06965 [Pseudomonas sp. SK]|uniref:hypothetical protein n=1 Tax=Pseudomonas sp. SK TaxID=2729423 RepID=UPI0014646FD0|nr:hypothetical protein [Pseudomonas sp. SK]QJQ19693.1 hypothetical protein HG549_06965 [Pseudomonas sp. SK]
MPSVFPSVAVAALFASAPVWAQSTQLADQIAPSAFLGVDLRGNFLADVPACVLGNGTPSEPCRIETDEPGRFEVLGLPYLPISPGYKLFATVASGSVSQLMLTGNASKLYLVKEMLTEELGKPATSSTRWVKLKSGASYETETFEWNTQEFSVNFKQDLDDFSRYFVTFSPLIVGAEVGRNETTHPGNTSNW